MSCLLTAPTNKRIAGRLSFSYIVAMPKNVRHFAQEKFFRLCAAGGTTIRSKYNRFNIPGPSFWYTNSGALHFQHEMSSHRECPPLAFRNLSPFNANFLCSMTLLVLLPRPAWAGVVAADVGGAGWSSSDYLSVSETFRRGSNTPSPSPSQRWGESGLIRGIRGHP